MPPPQPAARVVADYQRADAAHYLHPFTDSAQLGARGRVIDRADGVYVWDVEGAKALDAMSGLWCVNIGYGRREMAAAAARQMERLPYYNSFFQCAPAPTIDLAERLAALAPVGFNRVFFTGSGSESNDTVIRMIRRYWELRGRPNRKIIISRVGAYHGSSIAAASMGGMSAMHAQGGLPLSGFAHIRQPYHYGEGNGMDKGEFGLLCARALADKIEELGADNVAAFIGEPAQGAGGVIIPPESYWPEIQKICDHHELPIVADEVICGFGRLGRWFGSERFGVRPKLMPLAKGLTSGYLPMGAVLAHDDIADLLAKDGGEFAHGFTYGGHPTCAAVALENIRIISEEKIIDRVRDHAEGRLQEAWATLADHPLVGETRGMGMIAALELAAPNGGGRIACDPPAGAQCRDLSVANGLIMRAVGDAMIISPPLVISDSEIDELVCKARRTLDDLAERLLL